MEKNDMCKKDKMNRRNFLKIVGISTVAATAGVCGCAPKKEADASGNAASEVPEGKMTCRNFPPSPDRVSLLGYGCMRWPTLPSPAGDGNVIDQEEVNRLVDYAIGHGVNYFDTAPVYVQGWSERSTGMALKRHPREKYFIATKMSNFDRSDFKSSVEMYHDSMKHLQVDYIDYYLLHSLGSSGKRSFKVRFLDNGLLDYLLKEREAGRIRHLGWSFHGSKEEFDFILSFHEKVHWDFIQIQLNYSDWKYATGNNVNADYLYAEISRRNIPMVIMEPLLGGRLSKLPEHIFSRLKARNPEFYKKWISLDAKYDNLRFAGGESKAEVGLRMLTALREISSEAQKYRIIGIASHEDSILQLLKLLSLPLEHIDNAGYFHIVRDGKEFKLVI